MLKAYKIGPNVLKYEEYASENQIFLRQSGFYTESIRVEQGHKQSNIDSAITFNIIVDTALRCWMKNHKNCDLLFYVVNRFIENKDPVKLQQDLDTIISLFAMVGLKTNETKLEN